jgi:uridylate kinase
MFNLFDEPLDLPSEQPAQPSESTTANSRTFVVSIGGSMLFDGKPNTSFIGKISHLVSTLHSEGYSLVLVAGGGTIARDLIAASKALGANNFQADELAIKTTRLNAKLLIQGIEKAHPQPLKQITDVKEILEHNKIPVYAGLMPPFTTDSIAALLAEFLNCEFINLTNVDGIYSNDPKKDPNAVFHERLSFKRLIQLIAKESLDIGRGTNVPIDLITALIINRSKIKTYIINANNLENFEALVRGQGFYGTTIQETE